MTRRDTWRYLGIAALTAFATTNAWTFLMGAAGGRENTEHYVQLAGPVERAYMDLGKPGRELGYVLRDIAKR